MILALIVFLVFLVIVILGVWRLIKLDTNTPDTDFINFSAHMTYITKNELIPAFNKFGDTMKKFNKAPIRLTPYL